MYKQLTVAIGIAMLLTQGCSQANRDNSEMSEAPAGADISSSAAVEKRKDNEHIFVRTADIKFRTKDVRAATYDIENIVQAQGGYVGYTKLESQIDYVEKAPISSDSLMETTHYTVQNTMTLRVPNIHLDSTLRAIARNVEYLNHRTITATDVKLQIIANIQAQKRASKTANRIETRTDKQAAKLGESTEAEAVRDDKQAAADYAAMDNMQLGDQVAYSTVELDMYQRASTVAVVIPNMDKSYRPGMGTRLASAMSTGWYMLQSIVVALASIWTLILLAILGYIGFRYYKRSRAI